MPQYFYICNDCNERQDEFLSMSESAYRPKCLCGKKMDRDFIREHMGFSATPGNWPMKSLAMGVHEDQIGDAYAESVRLGVPTQFDSEGCAIFTSPRHRKNYMEAMGYYDKNGGYSDPRRGIAQKRYSPQELGE